MHRRPRLQTPNRINQSNQPPLSQRDTEQRIQHRGKTSSIQLQNEPQRSTTLLALEEALVSLSRNECLREAS
jgi:hypothetical protein